MITNNAALAEELRGKLISFQDTRELPGISIPGTLECLIKQVIDSIRRIEYINTLLERDVSINRINPSIDTFDPVKAAVYHKRNGNLNEAFWLVFLLTHFGKSLKKGWGLIRSVYSGLGESIYWDWENSSRNTYALCEWISENREVLKERGNFGNHRKYESLKATGTGLTISSYMNWIGESSDHLSFFNSITDNIEWNSRDRFNLIYKSMSAVERFGRTGKFDYLTMLGKLKLIDIEPGLTYMQGATGPISGARLLFDNGKSTFSPKQLEAKLAELEQHLGLYFGMQVLEDALCNWQKSPIRYKRFKG